MIIDLFGVFLASENQDYLKKPPHFFIICHEVSNKCGYFFFSLAFAITSICQNEVTANNH